MFSNDFELAIKQMQELGLKMDTVLIKQGDELYSHVFDEGTQRKNIRSISKTVVSLCVGKAIEEGFFPLGIEEPVYKFFAERKIENEENIQYLRELRIKHLITLTLGHAERTMNSDQMKTLIGKDLVDFILNYPIKHAPGDYFLYTNPPAYLMSYIIQKATGKKLLDYAREKFFSPLGIENVSWKESEQGYNMGCTGIEIQAFDLLKIGELLLNFGCYNGKRLINKEWICEMTKVQVRTQSMEDITRVLPKYGYGFNLWVCENGNYYGDGTDGQYLIVIPKKGMIIVTMGFQSNMKPITECLRTIIL